MSFQTRTNMLIIRVQTPHCVLSSLKHQLWVWAASFYLFPSSYLPAVLHLCKLNSSRQRAACMHHRGTSSMYTKGDIGETENRVETPSQSPSCSFWSIIYMSGALDSEFCRKQCCGWFIWVTGDIFESTSIRCIKIHFNVLLARNKKRQTSKPTQR